MDHQTQTEIHKLLATVTQLHHTVQNNANFFLEQITELQDRIATANRLIRELHYKIHALKQNA